MYIVYMLHKKKENYKTGQYRIRVKKSIYTYYPCKVIENYGRLERS